MVISSNKVWTTEKIKELISNIEKNGVSPKETPFFKNDTSLRAPDINYGYTAHELRENAKCALDPIYFGENYANVMTDEGVRIVSLRDYQQTCLTQFNKYRKNILLSSRQSGKCVSWDTMINIRVNGIEKTIPIYKLYNNRNYSIELILMNLINLLKIWQRRWTKIFSFLI
jgi:hypothetical protein